MKPAGEQGGPLNLYDLVILDFDGTLADSASWFRPRVNEVARKYRFRQISDSEFEDLRGQSTAAIINYLGMPGWKLPFIARHLRRIAARDIDQINLFPGVGALLSALKASSVTIAIVTSNNEANVRRILGPENAAHIDFIAPGASLYGKPAKIRSVLKRFNADPARTLAIGDEERDIESARSTGVAAGAVNWGYATPDLLAAAEPDHQFGSMDKIRQVVTGADCLQNGQAPGLADRGLDDAAR
jgi:phosphoglycolate phosphatase